MVQKDVADSLKFINGPKTLRDQLLQWSRNGRWKYQIITITVFESVQNGRTDCSPLIGLICIMDEYKIMETQKETQV